MRTYRVWTGCGGWVRRTTTEAVWRATPRFKGIAVAIGCGGGLLVGGGVAVSHGDWSSPPAYLINGGGGSVSSGRLEGGGTASGRLEGGGSTSHEGSRAGGDRWQAVYPAPPIAVPVPEPGTVELLIVGAVGALALRRFGK